jgi:hypothetical protein
MPAYDLFFRVLSTDDIDSLNIELFNHHPLQTKIVKLTIEIEIVFIYTCIFKNLK